MAEVYPQTRRDVLRVTLAQVGRRALAVWWTTLLLAPLGAVVLLLLVGLLTDHALVLPPWIRLLLLGAAILLAAWLVRRTLRRRPRGAEEELARLVERRFPQLDNLLINSIQLARRTPPGGEALVGALVDDAAEAVERIAPGRAVPRRALAASAAVTAAGALLLLGLALFDRQALGVGLNRVLLPYADNTLTRILEVTPGDCDVLRHADLVVSARFGGIVPTEARLLCTFADGTRVELPMRTEGDALPERQQITVRRVEQDLTYQVAAGDDRAGPFQIRMHERPAVRRVMQTVQLPPYVRAQPVEQAGGTIQAVLGSTVQLRVHADQPPREGTLVLDDARRVPLALEGSVGKATLEVRQRGRYTIELTSAQGFASEPAGHDIIPLEDQPPRVSIADPTGDITVDIDAVLGVQVEVHDDFAVRLVELHRVDPAADAPPSSSAAGPVLAQWSFPERDQAAVRPRATVRVAELGLDAGHPVALRALAYDFRPDGPPGASALLTIRLSTPSEGISAGTPAGTTISLDGLLNLQRANLQASIAQRDRPEGPQGLAGLLTRQEQIRRDALVLSTTGPASADPGARTPVQRRLADLADTLMALAIEQLAGAARTPAEPAALAPAIDTEQAILRALTIADGAGASELADQASRQIAQVLAELIARQTALRADTTAATSTAEALAQRQRRLARDAAGLQETLQNQADTGAGGNRALGERYGQMAKALEERSVRAHMLVAAERLGAAATAEALALQEQVLADLAAILQMLREALLAEGRVETARLAEALDQTRQRLDQIAQLQQAITEVARQLRQTEDLTEGQPTNVEDREELAEARKNLADAVEQLVQDMHLLPAMSASNDLLEELGEIYEDVKQAEGSANDPITEVAVDRDEGLLAMIRQMQEKMGERMADLEMWMPDRPDSIKWKQESFDRDELGEIPLGDLPDALEDIVGDLVEQSEQLSEEAEDAASNAAIPDTTMGWDIMDGPMPSWAAKGKSGNERPNANEQVGRSGSGRQGQSSGELVGDTVKALEGAEVQARRTQDGAQAGAVKEEEPGAMDVKATGGGKLAGTTETEGMSGQAPPRDELAYRHLQGAEARMRRDAETLYTKARLLRLPTGQLDRAMLELDVASRRLATGDIAGFARDQEQVVRTLRQTAAELAGRPQVLGWTGADSPAPLEAGATAEPVPTEYEQAVARYLRRIAQPP